MQDAVEDYIDSASLKLKWIKRRVVVTGLGLISPLGNSAKTSWQNAIEEQSGAALISNFDTENFLTKFAATVKRF